MPEMIRILMLEDNIFDAEIVQRMLTKDKMEFEFRLALDKSTFLSELDEFNPNVILADNSLPRFTAREALEVVRKRAQHTPFIMVTGTISEEFAAHIIKQGADDYILKDRMARLPASIRMAIKQEKTEKKNEDALKATKLSSERFKTLCKATKDAVWDWNLLTGEIWWNENYFNLFGYNPSQPVPALHEWTRRIHPLDRNKVILRLMKINKENACAWEDEFRFKLPGGNYGTVLDRGYILKDDAQNPVRVIGVLVDITAQKELMQEMEILSMIAKETSNSVMIFERNTGHASWVNEGFTRYTGYTQEDTRGKDLWSILGDESTDGNLLDVIRNQIANNLPFSCDLRIYNKNNEAKWQFLCGQPLQEKNGNSNNYFVISTDISERRRMEEERLSNKMERQKELTRIILQAQEVERNMLGRELHDNINQILTAVNLKLGHYLEVPDHNVDIIKNCRVILDEAIQETRNLSHRMVMPHFANRSLKDELEMLVENYCHKKIVQMELPDASEKNIPSIIKETLFRIAQEQLSNIDKHAKADEIGVKLNIDPHELTMVIHDNGIGFDVQQRRKGIGINNIFSRVESYNGTADITSVPGEGCTLSVTIPF